MDPQTLLVIAVIFLLFISSPVISLQENPTSWNPDIQYEYVTFPTAVYSATLKSTIQEVQKVMSVVSNFAGTFDDFRLSNAIQDCVDLLDSSSDELSWSLTEWSKFDNSNTGKNLTASVHQMGNLKSWLSAAFSNQDTCLDGFEGTNGVIKAVLQGGLYQVNELIGNVLRMVKQIPGQTVSGESRFSGGGRRLLARKGDGFPAWFLVGDRRLLQSPVSGIPVNFTVAADGSGNFTTVMDAILAAPDYSERKFVIYVKRGIYKENVALKKKKWNLMLVGDGIDVTIISGNRSFVDGWTTFRTATFAVCGRRFLARDITFENTAGPQKHQAVALRVDSDLSAFFRCSIKGYQDTLYAHSLRQFYRECRISGTVDFIFGNGAAVFQNCQIVARKPLPQQKNTITAQGRKEQSQTTGFSFQYCNVSGESDLIVAANWTANATATYLGRPWKEYSQTVFMQSYLGNLIRPEGWLEWQGDFALNTLFYGEYMNYGPGAGLESRVKWPGFRVMNDTAQANNFTVSQFIDGKMWLPSTGVRFTAGLTV